MPTRILRPGLTSSKRWNTLEPLAQSFYVRLLTLVDDYGRFSADEHLLRSYTFPFGDSRGKILPLPTIARMCQQLHANACIVLYLGDDGEKYLQLTQWKERARAPSKFPAPPADICAQMPADASSCPQLAVIC